MTDAADDHLVLFYLHRIEAKTDHLLRDLAETKAQMDDLARSRAAMIRDAGHLPPSR